MKKTLLVLTPILVFSGMMACTPYKADPIAPIHIDTTLQNKEVEMILNSRFYGGQPGKIQVGGVVVREENGEMILDEKIKLQQTPGKSAVSNDIITLHVAKENLPVLNPKLSDKVLRDIENSAQKGQYINIGCKQFDPKLVEGLKEVPMTFNTKDFLQMALAETILICGKVEIRYDLVNLVADRMILIDADYSYSSRAGGNTSLRTNNLVLIGDNKISVRGEDDTSVVLPSSPITLDVAKSISGDGTLELSTIGGNCVPEKKK